MTITRLELERFTAFEALDFKPSPGINVLVGANGTGKTHLMKIAYAACDVSKTDIGFAEKIVRVFMPFRGAIGRLVKRRGEGSSCAVHIHRGDRRLGVSFSTRTKAAESATVNDARRWKAAPVESVYIPAKEMLANAPGFRSLYAQREIHFEEVYADILDRAYRPALRGPVPGERKRLLTVLQKEIDGKVQERREKFIEKFRSGALDEDLKYKYRDTFLYQWAAERVDKPTYYWVIIAMNKLTAPDLSARTDDLRRKLPLNGPPSGQWKRPIVMGCMVFNIDTWNRHQPRFPLSRIP